MSNIDEALLIAVSRTRNILFREMDALFREFNLTNTQFSVLEALYHKGDLSVGEIQKFILGTPGNVPLVIKNLEKAGLVLRDKHKSDGRISIISLTDKGLNLIKKVYPKSKDRLKEVLKDIEINDKKMITKGLIDVLNTISL